MTVNDSHFGMALWPVNGYLHAEKPEVVKRLAALLEKYKRTGRSRARVYAND